MNKVNNTLLKLFENIKVEFAFAFVFQIIKDKLFDKKELVEFFKNVTGEFKYESNCLIYKRFIPDYKRNISKLLKIKVDFHFNDIKQVSISSNYSLLTLFELKTFFLNNVNYSISNGYKDDSSLIVFNIPKDIQFETIKAYANGTLNERSVNENDIDLYEIILIFR